MFITYGTGFYGKIATHKEQWIETKFAYLMFIPLFPISSMYVTESEFKKRRGFDMALNTKSIIATYARLLTGVIAAGFFYIGVNSGSSSETGFIIMALLFAAAWVYFCFFYAKATPADIIMRNKVGSVTGIYALPHWLDFSSKKVCLKDFRPYTRPNILKPTGRLICRTTTLEPKSARYFLQ